MIKEVRRNFGLRDEFEREMLLEDAWCDHCREVGLGLLEPREFEGNGVIFLEGKCVECGHEVVSPIEELETNQK